MIRLDRFSPEWSRAFKQGRDLHALIKQERDALEEAQPDTATRYRTVPSAIHNVRRLARRHIFYNGMIVRDDTDRAIGAASAITNHTIKHPDLEQPVVGTDLDYWLFPNATQEQHRATAEKLIEFSGRLALNREGLARIIYNAAYPGSYQSRSHLSYNTVNSAFTVVTEGQPYIPVGLIEAMNSAGPVAELNVTQPHNDPFKVAKGGEPAQLYHFSQNISA